MHISSLEAVSEDKHGLRDPRGSRRQQDEDEDHIGFVPKRFAVFGNHDLDLIRDKYLILIISNYLKIKSWYDDQY